MNHLLLSKLKRNVRYFQLQEIFGACRKKPKLQNPPVWPDSLHINQPYIKIKYPEYHPFFIVYKLLQKMKPYHGSPRIWLQIWKIYSFGSVFMLSPSAKKCKSSVQNMEIILPQMLPKKRRQFQPDCSTWLQICTTEEDIS